MGGQNDTIPVQLALDLDVIARWLRQTWLKLNSTKMEVLGVDSGLFFVFLPPFPIPSKRRYLPYNTISLAKLQKEIILRKLKFMNSDITANQTTIRTSCGYQISYKE